jgi:hypothetical protein
MNDPGHHVREVPEPRLVAPHVLVCLKCSSVAGRRIGIGGHRITDTTKLSIRWGSVKLVQGLARRAGAGFVHDVRGKSVADHHAASRAQTDSDIRARVVPIATCSPEHAPAPSSSDPRVAQSGTRASASASLAIEAAVISEPGLKLQDSRVSPKSSARGLAEVFHDRRHHSLRLLPDQPVACCCRWARSSRLAPVR